MDKTLKKFIEERCFVQKMRIGVKKSKRPFARKERFLSLLEISDYSLLSNSFDEDLFAICIRFLQTSSRILPHDSVSLSLAQGALPQRLGNARTSSRATLASGGSHP